MTSNLDEAIAEHIARTVDTFEGKVTMPFIYRQGPKDLAADVAARIAEAREARLAAAE